MDNTTEKLSDETLKTIAESQVDNRQKPSVTDAENLTNEQVKLEQANNFPTDPMTDVETGKLFPPDLTKKDITFTPPENPQAVPIDSKPVKQKPPQAVPMEQPEDPSRRKFLKVAGTLGAGAAIFGTSTVAGAVASEFAQSKQPEGTPGKGALTKFWEFITGKNLPKDETPPQPSETEQQQIDSVSITTGPRPDGQYQGNEGNEQGEISVQLDPAQQKIISDQKTD